MNKGGLKVMNMSFSGQINLGKNFPRLIEDLLSDSLKINWEFIEETGKSGCERPPRLIGKMKEGKFPTIIVYPSSGKIQIMGSKSRKEAEVVFEVALKDIKKTSRNKYSRRKK